MTTCSCTLDSGIEVVSEITVAPPLKNFHIIFLILFYINLLVVSIKKWVDINEYKYVCIKLVHACWEN